MRLAVLFAFLFASVVVGGDLTRQELIKKEMDLLQGDWSMVEGERDGEKLPEKLVKTGKRVAKGDLTIISINGTTMMKATFTIDPTQKPKTIDYVLTEGPNKGKTQLGIYELDGDQLKFCVSAIGNDRPTAFEAKEGSSWSYVLWKRDKK